MLGILAWLAIVDPKIRVFLLRRIRQRAIQIDVEISVLMLPFVGQGRQPLGHQGRQATDIQIVGIFRTLDFGNRSPQLLKGGGTACMKTQADGIQP